MNSKSTCSVLLYVMRNSKYKIITALTGALFAFSYMIFTGIFIFTERAIPDEFTVPLFHIGRIHTVYGDFPWFIAYLDRHTIFSMTSEALASTIVISILVGINTTFLAFRLSNKNMECRTSASSIGFFGIIPAFLTIFACCGGGILVMLLGAGVLSALFSYGPVFSITSITILLVGVLFSAKNIAKTLEKRQATI